MSAFLLPDSHLNLLAFAVKTRIPKAFKGSHQELVELLRRVNEENVQYLYGKVHFSTPPWEHVPHSPYTAPKLPDFLSTADAKLGILVTIESYFYQCAETDPKPFAELFSVLKALRDDLLASFDPPLSTVWDARLNGLDSLFWCYMESGNS